LILKFTTKQISIVFLALFIGSNCAGKNNLKKNKEDKQNHQIAELSSSLSEPVNQNIISDVEPAENAINDLTARVKYLEELLNSYQAQSMALENPTIFFNKKILLTNGSMLYGNITYQDDLIVQLETLIGTLAVEKNTIMRNIWLFVIPVYLKIDSSFLLINFIKNNKVEIKKINGNMSKIIDGVFSNDKNKG